MCLTEADFLIGALHELSCKCYVDGSAKEAKGRVARTSVLFRKPMLSNRL